MRPKNNEREPAEATLNGADQREPRLTFVDRHIGPTDAHVNNMLSFLKLKDLDALIERTTPPSILSNRELKLPAALSECDHLKKAQSIARKNKIFKNFIGQGYYGTWTPTVIQRNILENPGWYTAYTPYQAEISQGRMEALLNFQTMISDLTALPLANASLLDEGTAAAEGVYMAKAHAAKNKSNKLFVAADVFEQTLSVIKTRAKHQDIEVIVGDAKSADFSKGYFAAVIQSPNRFGELHDLKSLIKKMSDNDVQSIVGCDLLAVCVFTPPGEVGADIAFGSAQRFGVPVGFGGPHAAFLSVKEEYKRLMPGRIIGVSKDAFETPALRLALQTREQHIRRERATSNICTSQVLLAVMASMYAVYHGPKGLRSIAECLHRKTGWLRQKLEARKITLATSSHFDTLAVACASPEAARLIVERGLAVGINLGWDRKSQIVTISLDECTTLEDLGQLVKIVSGHQEPASPASEPEVYQVEIDDRFRRESFYLGHPVFNSYHSESELLRYMRRLEGKDLALNHSMIPLGSCTMKLNATSEMIPVSWPEFNQIHPLAPEDQYRGYLELFTELESWLCEITGFAAMSLQPNAGSQGEYAGLLTIRNYLDSRGETGRNVCLIPSSAHGTNPASAVMAGMKVVVVQCDAEGNVDLEDLNRKATEHSKDLAALMVTYPSTHGVFEESIRGMCQIVHENGGQVYMDGANFNALVGIAKPGEFGVDVSHLNLHKTFCIPHGGGGPGVGPIGVAKHLVPFLPGHPQATALKGSGGPVSAAPWGSASILPISWGYIAMMGGPGLKKATQIAILNANYIAKKLEPHFPIVYKNKAGWVAHECIIDVRKFKETAGITVDDIAKRLMDYGFHAPTMSWPVAGTLMIEPTESESQEELDRFCEAMISIRQEIQEIEDGEASQENNVLKNAPHTIAHLMEEDWLLPYSKGKACFPTAWVKTYKFWPSVGRIDNAYGDKHLVCTCLPLEAYAQSEV